MSGMGVELVHYLFASRQPAVKTTTKQVSGNLAYKLVVEYPASVFSLSVCGALGACQDITRFLLILFVVIPWLACSFVILGIIFHIPRIAATYACKYAIAYCVSHIHQGKNRRLRIPKATVCNCSGRNPMVCCYTCKAASYLISREVWNQGYMQCCRCGGCL